MGENYQAKHESGGPRRAGWVWSRPADGWVRWYVKQPRREISDPSWDARSFLLGLVLGPAAFIGGVSGVIVGGTATQVAESALAMAVGVTFSTILVLYLLRPATIPRGTSLWSDLKSVGRWVGRRWPGRRPPV